MTRATLVPPVEWGIDRITAEVDEDNNWNVLTPEDPDGDIAALLETAAEMSVDDVMYTPDPTAKWAVALADLWPGSEVHWERDWPKTTEDGDTIVY